MVGRVMHPTRRDSDLARIAAAPSGAMLSLHAWTFDVLALSLRLWRSSGGHFDPCIPSSPACSGELQLIAPCSVRAPPRPAVLDLGGIAKGFAIDKAIEVLVESGCFSCLVNVGGDVRAFGPRVYEIDLRLGNALPAQVRLAGRALAVSAPKSARSPSEHRGFYSRITGTELAGRTAVVLAPTAAAADALTKSAIACPPPVLRRMLEEFSASLLPVS